MKDVTFCDEGIIQINQDCFSLEINYKKLKAEIQTNRGLLSIIKKEKMPSQKEMANLAWKKIENETPLTKDYVNDNFNDLLKRLILTEYSIYKEFEKALVQKSLKIYLDGEVKQGKKFSELEKIFEKIRNELDDYDPESKNKFIGELTVELYPVMNLISVSCSQGAKSRAGSSLENHLENLFRVLDFKFETQKELEGARIDFIFPSIQAYHEQSGDCIFLASQTTLKDRFRLSLAKISSISNARKYIVTATGAGIITPSDKHDLNTSKVQEIREKGFRIIVLDEVKEKFKDNRTVVSYSYFVKTVYPAISKLWFS